MSQEEAHVAAAATRPCIVKRTRGYTHGLITRLMSPSDFGRLLKPFVFLDFFDNDSLLLPGNLGLHPHSGIATVTYLAEGCGRYGDTTGATGLLRAGGLEWLRAGGGVWHSGGGSGEPGRTRGFQLWIALPPELELGSAESVYLAPDVIPHNGPARVLLGCLGAAKSLIQTPASMNYLAVRLKTGEQWSYQPPVEHTVLWTAIALGSVLVPDELQQGELVAFRPCGALQFEAKSDTEFMVGSAVSREHELVLGTHSVHTSAKALREAEARISGIRARLIQQGRI
jgi:redox-sensitive bicupin YhaK (pirin superfamily)